LEILRLNAQRLIDCIRELLARFEDEATQEEERFLISELNELLPQQ
jgi:hypothetical protein